MEVVWRGLDTGKREGQKKGREIQVLILFLTYYSHISCPSLTIKISSFSFAVELKHIVEREREKFLEGKCCSI